MRVDVKAVTGRIPRPYPVVAYKPREGDDATHGWRDVDVEVDARPDEADGVGEKACALALRRIMDSAPRYSPRLRWPGRLQVRVPIAAVSRVAVAGDPSVDRRTYRMSVRWR